MIKTKTKKQETATQNLQSNLQPDQAYDLIIENQHNPDFGLLDVCTKKEFDQRHLENAVNISFLSRSFKSEIRKLDRNKSYLVYCTLGGRSSMAVRTMKKAGFKKVYNLVGGTLFWEEYECKLSPKGKKKISVFTCNLWSHVQAL